MCAVLLQLPQALGWLVASLASLPDGVVTADEKERFLGGRRPLQWLGWKSRAVAGLSAFGCMSCVRVWAALRFEHTPSTTRADE